MSAVTNQCSLLVGWLTGLALLVSAAAISSNAQAVVHRPQQNSAAKYLDAAAGKTVDELVSLALANNAELGAMRKEAEAGEALLRQASLRPAPR